MKIAVENKSKLYIALITTLISLIILVTGTYAWFTLSLSGKVQEMELKVTAGDSLFIDTVSHGNNADAYQAKNTVNNDDVLTQLRGNSWFDNSATFGAINIFPVTSGNGKNFYSQSNTAVEASALQYMQFDLYFIATRDMHVYLTENDSSTGAGDGTKVSSKNTNSTSQAAIDKCVRISFAETGQAAKIYEPNRSGNTTLTVSNAISDNGSATMSSTFDDPAAGQAAAKLFDLTANTEKKITVTIWIEGDDPQCNDDVKSAVFLTQLRFEGQ